MELLSVEKQSEQGSSSSNLLGAGIQGATSAVYLILNVVANLIAILAFIAFANACCEWMGNLVGFQGITFSYLIGKALLPVAWTMGIPEQVSHDGLLGT